MDAYRSAPPSRKVALFSDPLPLLPDTAQLLLPSECISPDASALSLLFSEDHHKVRQHSYASTAAQRRPAERRALQMFESNTDAWVEDSDSRHALDEMAAQGQGLGPSRDGSMERHVLESELHYRQSLAR